MKLKGTFSLMTLESGDVARKTHAVNADVVHCHGRGGGGEGGHLHQDISIGIKPRFEHIVLSLDPRRVHWQITNRWFWWLWLEWRWILEILAVRAEATVAETVRCEALAVLFETTRLFAGARLDDTRCTARHACIQVSTRSCIKEDATGISYPLGCLTPFGLGLRNSPSLGMFSSPVASDTANGLKISPVACPKSSLVPLLPSSSFNFRLMGFSMCCVLKRIDWWFHSMLQTFGLR